MHFDETYVPKRLLDEALEEKHRLAKENARLMNKIDEYINRNNNLWLKLAANPSALQQHRSENQSQP